MILNFRATLTVQLDMFLFPFDQYFLDIKIRWVCHWHSKKYVVMHYTENKDDHHLRDDSWFGKETFGSSAWKRQKKRQFRKNPLQIALLEDIRSEIRMLPAWINFSTFRFKLVRLRIDPKPDFFITNILFPFLMIVSCSFSIFAIDFENGKDRLSVSVIILLTCTAFQSLISDQLPRRSEMMLIDWYIVFAFLIQIMLVISTLLIAALIQLSVDIETVYMFDSVFGATLGALWIMVSAFYLSLNNTSMRNVYDKSCCCTKLSFNDWERRNAHDNLQEPHFQNVGFAKIDDEENAFGMVDV